MAICELVGGPRDGETFTVVGALPPERIKILYTRGGPLIMWHPAAAGAYPGIPVVTCELEDTATANSRPNTPWRYVWPRHNGSPPPPGVGPPLL